MVKKKQTKNMKPQYKFILISHTVICQYIRYKKLNSVLVGKAGRKRYKHKDKHYIQLLVNDDYCGQSLFEIHLY